MLDIFVWSNTSRVQKTPYFFEYTWIFKNFSTFFEVFRAKLFCAAGCSHVLTIIRILIKFHVELSICHHWGRFRGNGFQLKTDQIDFTWVNIPRNSDCLLIPNFLEYSEGWTHAETLNQQVEKVIIQFKYCINYRNYCTFTWWINF